MSLVPKINFVIFQGAKLGNVSCRAQASNDNRLNLAERKNLRLI